jgi:UDP-N-acetylmuramate dehydrogenase
MGIEILDQVPLAPYTTLKVGGNSKYLVKVDSAEQLTKVQQFAKQTAAPLFIMGGGSNVLVSDEGFSGLTIHNCILGITYTPIDDATVQVKVGAGESLDALVADAVSRGYWGLENLSHIPGTVGAAPIQNVGAYGVEMSDVVVSVTAFSMHTGEYKTFMNDECNFAYRDSYFKTNDGRCWVVTTVTFELSTERNPLLSYGDLQNLDSDTVSLIKIREAVITVRSGKFPDWEQVGTAGSFFKNPIITSELHDQLRAQYPDVPTFLSLDGCYKISLGWILDKVCGLRGYQQGQVGLYKNQALVLINNGDSAAAIKDFVTTIQAEVFKRTGVTIEPEVRYI